MSLDKLGFVALLITLLPLGGCGGASASGAGAKTKADGEDDGAASAGESEGEAEAAVDLRAAACADGTCAPCGDGICPGGFYCDEKAPGGPACSWLPECAAKASCGCVSQVLGSGCSCEERGGGVFVKCD